MKVLIADDSTSMRMLVKRALRAAGFEDMQFEDACNGKEALEAVSAGDFQLVLSDWNMPEMNGLEVLKAIRESGDKVMFGFITTEATTEMRQIATAAGARFLIAKPFTAESISETLNPILR